MNVINVINTSSVQQVLPTKSEMLKWLKLKSFVVLFRFYGKRLSNDVVPKTKKHIRGKNNLLELENLPNNP